MNDPPQFLQRILQKKKEEIALLSKSYPIREDHPPVSFYDILSTGKNRIIAECKKGSPSAGIICPNYHPETIALEYERCGAAAISVLTDVDFFYGSINDLSRVASVVSVPVLRKDFILEEIQILEARYYGASSVLLIVRILTPKKLSQLLEYARGLGMEPLVEAHTVQEVEIAVQAGAKIIGVNSRDLDTFQFNEGIIFQAKEILPKEVLLIAESGIKDRESYLRVSEVSNACLIGTYFMKSSDISQAYRALIQNP